MDQKFLLEGKGRRKKPKPTTENVREEKLP